jgi:asparagine synthase (glutamine-hydrolysing)
MCGIFVIGSKKDLTEKEIQQFKKNSQYLTHRGPDAEGFYFSPNKKIFMAHKRLAILDLTEKANQPMKKGDCVIVFNGEIYNFREIKKMLQDKGYKFETNSDTEVILNAYQEFGNDCLRLFKGMFAFCIYDEKKNTLFCARDRIGEKPLIYYSDEDYFIVSSEINPIIKLDFIKKEINKEALFLYSLGTYRHIPEPFSIWKNIRKLKPGSYLVVENGNEIKENFYYHPRLSDELFKYPKEKVKKIIKEKLTEAVELTTVADVPVSILLSGGVDSSIIAYILKEVLHKEVVAFTYGKDPEDEEIKRAKFVAEKLKIPHRIFYFDRIDVENRMKEILKIYGEPLALLQFAYSDVLYGAIRKQGFKVVINGNGGDELFYGYISQPKVLLFSYLIKFLNDLKILNNVQVKTLKYFLSSKKSKNIFDFKIVSSLFKEYDKMLAPFSKKLFIDFSNFWALISENAHSITLVGDVSGMKNSVEVRSPFLNHEIVELAFSLNPKLKIKNFLDTKGQYTKWILKEAFQKTPIEKIFSLPKMGFGFNVPLDFRFKEIKTFREWALKIFMEEFEVKSLNAF